jgi:hypothetical protein
MFPETLPQPRTRRIINDGRAATGFKLETWIIPLSGVAFMPELPDQRRWKTEGFAE